MRDGRSTRTARGAFRVVHRAIARVPIEECALRDRPIEGAELLAQWTCEGDANWEAWARRRLVAPLMGGFASHLPLVAYSLVETRWVMQAVGGNLETRCYVCGCLGGSPLRWSAAEWERHERSHVEALLEEVRAVIPSRYDGAATLADALGLAWLALASLGTSRP